MTTSIEQLQTVSTQRNWNTLRKLIHLTEVE